MRSPVSPYLQVVKGSRDLLFEYFSNARNRDIFLVNKKGFSGSAN